ncbi:DUF3299 domain-containing protein [Draconibacterium sp.]|nr:DUF3299 domain-containing protein [Draconibacterium sp.]
MKKWGIAILIIVVVAGLYFIEYSKIETGNVTSNAMPTLDDLRVNEAARNWDKFYRVRATIIDGQNAEFSIPKDLLESVGKEMKLTGAAVFFSPGCKAVGDKIAVHSFFLYPTLGLANACIHLPEVAMRWTVRINLKEDWVISGTDMIDAVVNVQGKFRIDTNKPYESAFFLDSAKVEIVTEEEVQF